MIGHRTRFRENEDLPLWRGPAVKKKPPFSNARALITRKIMRSRDAQYCAMQYWGMTLTESEQLAGIDQWGYTACTFPPHIAA